MRLGYACINESIKSKFKTCRLATFREQGIEKIKELSLYNLEKTLEIIKWNIKNDIHFYRLTSELIPFGSHPEMNWRWWEDEEILAITNQIKKLKEKYDLRLTLHPGQYTVLNSPKQDIVEKSIVDLEYHNKILDLIDGSDMILHTGGAYGDKESAKERFILVYQTLSDSIKMRLRLENDDKTFTLKDVLEISKKTGVPVCFDIHHHICNPSEGNIDEYIEKVFKSWENFGIPKIHISSGKTSRTDRSHHDYISDEDFDQLLTLIKGKNADIMFESKKKDLSVLKQKERFSV